MIYSEEQVKTIILNAIQFPETEVIEYKEAKATFSFNEMGKYFSALSNEANLREKKEGWLIFGINDAREIVGTDYRKDGNLASLKREIVNNTNERSTFLEIYTVFIQEKRVIAFQIPAATRGIPTTWNGAVYSRENESLAPLPLVKLDLIRSQIGVDWSKEIVENATLDDLDSEAIKCARELFIKKKGTDDIVIKMLEQSSDEEILNKAGILLRGKITNTALLLLGKSEASQYFDGLLPRITWTLYNADLSVKAYEHFDMPLLLAVDKAYSKIRNENYRYIAAQGTLFPEEVKQYDQDVIKEVINNCIAHSNYQLRGKINIEEFEDKLTFINEGAFIPETVEKTLEEGYKPPYYRNTFLCEAMVNLYMIDTISMGIPKMFNVQREKCFPLPTYDLSDVNRVKVTLYGRILDKNYTQLLHANGDLDLRTVFLLDKVQKRENISREDFLALKKEKLVEGRYPNIYVSYKVANIVGTKTEYIKNQGFGEDVYQQMIVNVLRSVGRASVRELVAALEGSLPVSLNARQRSRKISNMLNRMKELGIVDTSGKGVGAVWFLI